MSKAQSNPQDELIAKCRQGDRGAFNRLIQTYQDQVFTYLFHLTDDEKAAAEMTRKTFVAAYKRLNRYPDTLSIKGWLLSLADQQVRARRHRPGSWLTSVFSHRQTRPTHAEERPEAFGTKEPGSPDCQIISPLLSAYLDGELSELDAKRVARHLAQCERCQQEYDDLLETLNTLQTFGPQQAPPDLRVHINAAIDNSSSLWKSLARWFDRPGARIITVMAMLMLVFSGVLYNQHRHIQRLEQKFVADTRRGASPVEGRPTKTTFVILTGTATIKDILLEDAGWLARLITSPPEETELLFIQGSQAELRGMLAERIRSINGKIIDETHRQEKSFHVCTLTVEVPENISEFLLSVLRPLDVEETSAQGVVNTVELKIMIIEKE